jgi:acyl-CoA synthetase (AMP-forming)/AMP-acid ligase II
MIHHSPHPDVDLGDDDLHQLVLHGLAQRGDQTAIIDTGTGRSITGSQMIGWITDETRRLQGAGLAPGDTIGLAGQPGAAWLATAFGAIGAGLTVVPLNPMVPPALATAQMTAADASAVIADDTSVDWATRAAGATRTIMTMSDLTGPRNDDLNLGGPSIDLDADAFLLSSSGTTGMPKLVRITHRAMAATVQLVPAAVGFGPDDTMLAALPLFHAGGLTIATIPLVVGARLVIQPSFDPAGFVAAIETHEVTGTVVVPPICQALLTHPAVDGHDLSSLRFIQSTAAPLAPAIQEQLAMRLDCHVGQGLGLTEALPISLTTPGEPIMPGSSGRAVPNTELRLVDTETGTDVADRNGIGELWVRGPQVMAGYHHDPQANAAALTDERWLRTGDLCRIDSDGNVFVVDRLKELIKVNGYQVAPAAIEAILLQHPAVVDCAVVGRPNARRGEVPVAWIVTRHPVDADDLIELAAAQTPPYARLHGIVETDTIPRNPTGKILRRALRQQEQPAAAAT